MPELGQLEHGRVQFAFLEWMQNWMIFGWLGDAKLWHLKVAFGSLLTRRRSIDTRALRFLLEQKTFGRATDTERNTLKIMDLRFLNMKRIFKNYLKIII
jgi:hypothetical protein